MMNFQFFPGPLVTQRHQVFFPLHVALVQTLELDSRRKTSLRPQLGWNLAPLFRPPTQAKMNGFGE